MEGSDATAKIEGLLRETEALQFIFGVLADFPKADVYLVGGAVRDAILARVVKDFDFVVRGVPEDDLASWLDRHGRVDFTGRTFGVYKFLPTGTTPSSHEFIDIALPRTEDAVLGSKGGYRDFTVRSNPFLPIIKDLERRDFTINAMAFDVRASELLDPFGGRADVDRRVIRAVGEPSVRFREDLSRLLRAIRFACQLDFEIDETTWQALRKVMPEINVRRIIERPIRTWLSGSVPLEFVVPRETIGREFMKSLCANPSRSMDLWRASGALGMLAPELEPVWNSTSLMDILAPLGAKKAGVLYDRLKLGGIGSNHPCYVSRDDVVWLLERLEETKQQDPLTWRLSRFERVFFSTRAQTLLHLIENVTPIRDRINQIRDRLNLEPTEAVPILVRGEDVMESLSLPPGPKIGQLLEFVRDEQLAGRITNREEALEFLRSREVQ